MFNRYPYTNFHELNLDYFIQHFNEIFTEWEQLYNELTSWKTDTTEELTQWRADVEEDLNDHEAALRAELEIWKQDTADDISEWETATLNALDAWKTAATTQFEAIRVQAAASAEAAAASQMAAETARTQAQTAQAAAETAAQSVQASTAQIQQNTDDISELKKQINQLSGVIVTPTPETTQSGYYTGSVGSTIAYTDAENSSAKMYDLSQYVGKTVTVKGTSSGSGSSERIFALCNSSGVIAELHLEKEYTPDGISFAITAENNILYVSYSIYLTSDVTVEVTVDIGRIEVIEENIEIINDEINGLATERTPLALGTSQNGYYTGTTGNQINFTSANNSLAYIIDLSSYIGLNVAISAQTVASQSTRICAMCDSNGIIGDYAQEQAFRSGDVSFAITDTYCYLYISYNIYNTSNVSADVVAYGKIDSLTQRVDALESGLPVYVSPDGDDGNKGTFSAPVRTITQALTLNNHIVLKEGVYNGESINIDSYDYSEIEIKGQEAKQITINFGTTHLVDNGSETLVPGYTHVYSVPCETMPFASDCTSARMYQDYVGYGEIPANDRHPLQRGQVYRCDSTIIKQQTSIANIEALPSGEYGWFWDNGTLYFSRPQESSSDHPIVIPQRDTSFLSVSDVFYRARKQIKVCLTNIEVRYANIRLSYTANAEFTNVRVKYPYVSLGGCYYLYCTANATLKRCEAASVTDGKGLGDGINVDTDDAAGGADNVSLTARLVDCWSHDNNDDGYSDHDRSEVTVIGGLYEYNGKGGLTPAYGANDVILDCVSRYNAGAGILCTGNPTPNNGRLKTCVYAEGCICYGQKNGFYAPQNETIIQAVNCISYGNDVGYNTEYYNSEHILISSGRIYAVNCKSNDTTSKEGNVTVQTVNALT